MRRGDLIGLFLVGDLRAKRIFRAACFWRLAGYFRLARWRASFRHMFETFRRCCCHRLARICCIDSFFFRTDLWRWGLHTGGKPVVKLGVDLLCWRVLLAPSCFLLPTRGSDSATLREFRMLRDLMAAGQHCTCGSKTLGALAFDTSSLRALAAFLSAGLLSERRVTWSNHLITRLLAASSSTKPGAQLPLPPQKRLLAP